MVDRASLRASPQSRPPSQQWALPALSTDRLVLRPVGVGDLDLMVDLNADPAVMTYIRGRPATPDETAAEWRQRLDHQSDSARGLGYWASFDDGTFVGWWSASSFKGRPDISGIGYRLRARGWGRGLATEGAENNESRRVLEKLGMAQTATWAASRHKQQIPGWEHGEVAYELTRAEWKHP